MMLPAFEIKYKKLSKGAHKTSMAIKKILLSALLATSVSAHASGSFTVQDIKIEGLQRVALGAALLSIPVRVGDEFSHEEVAQTIKALYATGNFEEVSVYRENDVLIIRVVERPTIASISFSGNKAIKEEQLTQNLNATNIRVGEALDRAKLTNIEKGLEDFYYSVGKYNAQVKAVVTPLPRNRVDLKFVFSEGVTAKIKDITIIGNKAFDSDTLTSKFTLAADVPWWDFLANGKYQKQILAGDIETLKSFYLDRGYLKFQVTSAEVSISPDKKGVYITLIVDEGKPYKVNRVNFAGGLIGKEKEINALNPFAVGDTYNGSKVTDLEMKVKNILGEAGYAFPKVTSIPSFNDATQQVDLTINVEPLQRIYVRDIRFTGNTSTKDEVLRREMRQMEASWLNAKNIETSKTRLNRLGFFQTVDVQTVRVPGTTDQVDLVYKVKEANSGSINFGIGFGSESGLSFQAGIKQDNFLGTGNRVGINAMVNKYQKNVTLEYTDPYWTIDGVSLGGKVFYNEFEASEAGIIDYTNKSYGANLIWGFPFDELNRFDYGVGYTHNSIGNLTPYLQVEKFLCSLDRCDETSVKTNDYDISLSWTRNNLNKGYFPTSGNYQNASGKITVPGSDTQYFKLGYEVRQYFPLTQEEEYTLLLRGQLGYGNGYGKNGDNDYLFPFYENFYAGGFSTLRGFSANSAGPKAVYRSFANSNNGVDTVTSDSVGGNAMAAASVELIFPTPFVSDEVRTQLRTSVFVDTASVWDTEFSYRPDGVKYGNQYYYDYSDPLKYRASYGVALQWVSPIGPLVFSLAKPLKIYEGDDAEFFTFTIGRTF